MTSTDQQPHGLINNGNRCWMNALMHILMNIKEVREFAKTMKDSLIASEMQQLNGIEHAHYFVSKLENALDFLGGSQERYPTPVYEFQKQDPLVELYDQITPELAAAAQGNTKISGSELDSFMEAWTRLFQQDRKVFQHIAKHLAYTAIYDYYGNNRYTLWSAVEMLYAVSIMKDSGVIWVHHVNGDPNDIPFMSTTMQLLNSIIPNLRDRTIVDEYSEYACDMHLESCVGTITDEHCKSGSRVGTGEEKQMVDIIPFGDPYQNQADVFQTCAMIKLESSNSTDIHCSNAQCREIAKHKCISRVFSETAIFVINSVSGTDIAKEYQPIIPRNVQLPVFLRHGVCVMQQYKLVCQIHCSGKHYTVIRHVGNHTLWINDDKIVGDKNFEDFYKNNPITMMMYELVSQPMMKCLTRTLKRAIEIQTMRSTQTDLSTTQTETDAAVARLLAQQDKSSAARARQQIQQDDAAAHTRQRMQQDETTVHTRQQMQQDEARARQEQEDLDHALALSLQPDSTPLAPQPYRPQVQHTPTPTPPQQPQQYVSTWDKFKDRL